MWLFDKLLSRGQKGIWDDVDISLPMARAIHGWLNAFYNCPEWRNNHVRLSGLPAAITGFVATLVTNELTVTCGNSARAEFLDDQLQPLLRRMHNAVQLAAAGGQIIIKPFLQGDQFYFDLVEPGRFFPTRFAADDRVMAGYFADYRDVKGVNYVRIETFDCDGSLLTITNRAYRSTGDVLGAEVPLDTVEAWADIQPEVSIQGVSKPLFGAIKMPFANTVDDASPMPVSLYAGAMDTIMEFDQVFTEMIYELHSGKRKNIVESRAIIPDKKRRDLWIAKGVRYRDPSTDIYIVDPEEEHEPFRDYSPSIRTAEYMTGLKAILHMIENQCHLSPGTLSIDERSGAVTATQIISQDRTTYNTCSAIQQQGVTQGLLDVIDAMDTMCHLYNLGPAGELNPGITYGDSIFEDTQQEFARRLQLAQAGFLRPEKLLSWYFGVDEETATRDYLAAQTQTVDLFGGV